MVRVGTRERERPSTFRWRERERRGEKRCTRLPGEEKNRERWSEVE